MSLSVPSVSVAFLPETVVSSEIPKVSKWFVLLTKILFKKLLTKSNYLLTNQLRFKEYTLKSKYWFVTNFFFIPFGRNIYSPSLFYELPQCNTVCYYLITMTIWCKICILLAMVKYFWHWTWFNWQCHFYRCTTNNNRPWPLDCNQCLDPIGAGLFPCILQQRLYV